MCDEYCGMHDSRRIAREVERMKGKRVLKCKNLVSYSKKMLRNKIFNDSGFSLPIALLVMMLMTIGLAMYQTSLMSLLSRTAVRHYELQSYLSARSVATAVAEKIVDDTSEYIMAQSSDVLESFSSTLPDALVNGTSTRPLLDDEKEFMYALVDLGVGGELYLNGIGFEDLPDELYTGSLEAKITRTTVTEYVVSVTATVEGNTDTVHVILNGLADTVTTRGERVEEAAAGNVNAFYGDYPPGIDPYDKYNNQEAGMPFVSSVPNYLSSFHSETQYYDQIQSEEEIYYVNMNKTNGALISSENIYFEGGTVSGEVYIHSDKMVTIGPNSTINGKGIYADVIYLHGENILIATSLYAKTIIIDGTVALPSAESSTGGITVQTEELQIVMGSGVFIDEWGTAQGSRMTVSTQYAEIYCVSEPYFDKVPQSLKDSAADNSVSSRSELQIIPAGTYSISPTPDGEGYYYQTGSVYNHLQLTLLATQASTFEIASASVIPRTTPAWANSIASREDVFLIDSDFWEENDPVKGSNVVFVSTMLRGGDEHYYLINRSSYEDGDDYYELDLKYGQGDGDNIDASNLGELGDTDEQVVIVVEDGCTLHLTTNFHIFGDSIPDGAARYEPGLYIYLKGNAKLYIEKTSYNTGIRVFGEPASAEDDVIIRQLISDAVNLKDLDDDFGGDVTAYVADIQHRMHNVLESKLDSFSAICLAPGATLIGSCIAPYVYAENRGGDDEGIAELYMYGYPYSAGIDNNVLPDVADPLPEVETGGDGLTDVDVKLLYVNIHTYADTELLEALQASRASAE